MSEPRNIREKSLNDIYNQRDRLISMANGNRSRIERIMAISNRYANNIKRTREWAYDSLPASQRAQEAFAAARKKGYTTVERANADKRLTRKYGRFGGNSLNGGVPPSIVLPSQYNRKYSSKTYSK